MVRCRTCRWRVKVNQDTYYCNARGLLLREEEMDELRYCASYDPSPFSDVEQQLYNYLLEMGTGVAIASLPPRWRGAITKLKKLGIVDTYFEWVRISSRPNIKEGESLTYKRIKMIKLNEDGYFL